MELTIKDLKELLQSPNTEEPTNNFNETFSEIGGQYLETFLEVGGQYLFRTVTMIYTGEIVAMNQTQIKLKNAAWIADTGRFYDNLKSCEFVEVEPYPNEVVIFIGTFLDVTKIDTLPLVQK